MGRIVGIDYGRMRVGLAHSDEAQRMAFPLCVLPPHLVLPYLKEKAAREPISALVIGRPMDLRQRETNATAEAESFYALLKAHFPTLPLYWIDERYTSKIAEDALCALYKKGKMKRQQLRKSALDASSATLILQSYIARQAE